MGNKNPRRRFLARQGKLGRKVEQLKRKARIAFAGSLKGSVRSQLSRTHLSPLAREHAVVRNVIVRSDTNLQPIEPRDNALVFENPERRGKRAKATPPFQGIKATEPLPELRPRGQVRDPLAYFDPRSPKVGKGAKKAQPSRSLLKANLASSHILVTKAEEKWGVKLRD